MIPSQLSTMQKGGNNKHKKNETAVEAEVDDDKSMVWKCCNSMLEVAWVAATRVLLEYLLFIWHWHVGMSLALAFTYLAIGNCGWICTRYNLSRAMSVIE